MDSPCAPIPVVISLLPAGRATHAGVPLTAQIATCVAEAQEHGSIVHLPARERELRLARLEVAELEAIRAWLRDDREQFHLLLDLHALDRNRAAVVALQDMLDQARFRVVSVTLWALAPLWVADSIRESVDAGPLPCSPSAGMGERAHLEQRDMGTSREDGGDGMMRGLSDETTADTHVGRRAAI